MLTNNGDTAYLCYKPLLDNIHPSSVLFPHMIYLLLEMLLHYCQQMATHPINLKKFAASSLSYDIFKFTNSAK